MDRRTALKATSVLLGTTIIGMEAFLSGCTREVKEITAIDDEVVALLDDIGEMIIPETSSPGAKAAGIGIFMKTIVTDCYSESERKTFIDGINDFQKLCENLFGKPFSRLSIADKTRLMERVDQEARAGKDDKSFFNMVNQLTVWGFLSSEPGMTKALRYVPIPGKYEGCIDYKAGDSAWAY